MPNARGNSVNPLNLPLLFARRYLLAKRQQNAINLITLISIVVIAVVTAAMVVVLSTLNGISELVDSIYSPFDQDITITPAQGKTFDRDSLDLASITAVPGVKDHSWVIEENVLLRCGQQQAVATMKGVDTSYLSMSEMAGHMYSGEPVLGDSLGPLALIGIGLKVDLDAPLNDGVFKPLQISAPIRGRKLSKYQQGAFEQDALAIGGAFSINIEFDTKYVLVPIALADSLLHYRGAVNALELRTIPGTDLEGLQRALSASLGTRYHVQTRYQKNALMYRTNESEKWFTFVVLLFIGLIGAFNIIATLTMMMIEKKRDMRTLMSMGAPPSLVRGVFFNEGLLIVVVGVATGLLFGLGICLLQQHFGLVALSDSVVESYPVKVMWTDLVLVTVAVLGIGLLATWVPLRTLSRRFLHATSANP